MTEPSYYPLSPIKSPLQSATSPFPDQLKNESDSPPDVVATDDLHGSRSSMILAPLRTQLFRSRPSNVPSQWRAIKTPLEMALLPLAAIAYLAFCYTVHGKVVPVNTYGLYAVTPEHLATIKGGITAISIIIISIALYPVGVVISNLKSEEFFRILASRSNGVPLDTINHISTPSFGYTDIMLAAWRNSCSNYYILGTGASLLVWVIGTLAPGALTIDNVLADGPVMAFAIGAVSMQSVLNGTSTEPAFNASLNSATAASIAWAEIELGVQYSYGVANTSGQEYAAYIVPIPLDLPTTTNARWLSDVAGLNPSCSWASTNITTLQLPYNSSSTPIGSIATAHLLDFNLDVQIVSSDIPIGGSPFATVKDPTLYVTNHSTQALPSDGSTVFLFGSCQSGCLPGSPVDITLDLSSVGNTLTIGFTDQTWSMAVLTCLPNVTIETREIRSDGHGFFDVQPLPAGTRLTPQGNLNPIQTTALFSIATMSLTQNAGSLSGSTAQYASLGSQVQGDILFGKAQFDNLPGINSPDGTMVIIVPAATEDIAQGYTQVLQSASKSYLSGYLGTAYVPGRISASEVVFAASIPNLAVASAVFALLAALIVAAHFRPGKGIEFTLVNVAAAVHGSELPAQFARAKAERMTNADGQGSESESEGQKVHRPGTYRPDDHHDIVEMLGDKRIFMQRRADGSLVLHIT